MVVALDVNYIENNAYTVGVLFEWGATVPFKIITAETKEVDDYISGEFYKRELPCLLNILNKISLEPIEAIIIDGHVYIDNQGGLGLGGKLYEAMQKRIPIIGVAKNPFFSNGNSSKKVYRGKSKKPLLVSSIGIGIEVAVENVKNMKGDHRIPTILKQLDFHTKHPIKE